MKFTTGNNIVDQMGEIHISGNVVPMTWLKNILTEKGKPYLLAIMILADLVYWYRPTEIRDEGTGEVVGFKKKFKADLLQRSYKQFIDEYGESRSTITRALTRLEELGLIKRVFKEIKRENGTLSNVMFIEIFPEVIKMYTYSKEGVVKFEKGVLSNLERGCYQERTEGAIKFEKTNTYISNTNTSNTINPSDGLIANASKNQIMQAYENLIKNNIEYETLYKRVNDNEKELLNEILLLITDIVAVDRATVRINGTNYPHEIVKSKFLKLNAEHIQYVIASFNNNTTKINNIKSYILSIIYNAESTMNFNLTSQVKHNLGY